MDFNEYIRENEFGFDADSIKLSNSSKDKFLRVKPSKIEGIINEYFEKGKPLGISTGIIKLDPILRWRQKGGLYIVTGNEQSGKSEFIKYISVLRGINEGINTCLFSPEEDSEDIIEDLAMKYIGKPISNMFKGRCSLKEWKEAKLWIEKHFIILDYDGMVDFETLAKEYGSLIKLGYKNFVTDPWNYVAEGSVDSGGTKYLRTALSHMYTLSKRHNIWNFIIEHQNNKVDKNGCQVRATKDNIQGGSMWKHKATGIIIVHNNEDGTVEIEVAKNKNHRYNGVKGSKTLYFDIKTGRYLEEQNNEVSFQKGFRINNGEIGEQPF